MRKILSLLMAVVLGVSTAFATTVYCKMTHSWWNADGAAVAVHYWGDARTDWPGVRMTPVTGEEGTWSYDVPADDVDGLVFVRVNGTGDIAYWDAKTVDLSLPTDGKNLFTITNETASWGDPGCNGVWSIYGETPETPVEPTLVNGFYLIGQNGWDVAALSADLLFAANPEAEGEYVLNTTLAEGQSIKVVKVVNDAIVAWYPNGTGNEYTVDAAHAGENKDIYFQETYKEDWAAFGGHIWTGANEEPQPQECDWDNIDFLGDGSPEQTFSNQFKICKAGEYPGVVNIQKPDFAAETGIYVTFPSAVFGEISLADGQYVIQGAGMVLYLSAFTQEYTEVTVNCDGNDIVFTVYNAKGGTPEPTDISNTAADAKAVKVLNNGMLLIKKGNKTYNMMGQAVK